MKAWLLGLALIAVACGSQKPASSPGSPDRCKGAYQPPVCAGVGRRCETDENGCERCTCDSPTPIAPGGH
jgi:hypothetical protein